VAEPPRGLIGEADAFSFDLPSSGIFYEIRPVFHPLGQPVDVQIFSIKIVLTFCCCRQKVSLTTSGRRAGWQCPLGHNIPYHVQSLPYAKNNHHGKTK